MSPLHGAPARWAGFIDALLDAVWLVDVPSLTIVAANSEAGRLAGVPAAGLVGQPVADWVASPQDEALWQDLQQDPAGHATQASVARETWVPGLDGRLHPVTCRVSVLSAGAAAGLALVALRPRHAEAALRTELDQRVGELEATLESTADGILVTSQNASVQRFNGRFAQLWSLPKVLTRERNDAAIQSWLRQRVATGENWQALSARMGGERPAPTPEGGEALIVKLVDGSTLECRSRPLLTAGAFLGTVLSFRDLSETLRSQRQIERLLTTDRLTGLPTRQAFAQRMSALLTQRSAQQRRLDGPSAASPAGARRPAKGGEPPASAMLILGLDRFRTINDTLGTQAGDAVLAETARRLEGAVGRADHVARLGSDEFAIRLDSVDTRAAEAVARRLLATVAQPLEHEGTRFTLTASVGISMIDESTVDIDTSLQEASGALRRAKEAGRATFRFHLARHNTDLRERLRIDQAMREGLPAGDFRLFVQPQFELASGRLIGAEALLRWRDPVLGDVSPGRFIPMAEDNGFIVDLGQWVLDQATHLAAMWMLDGHPVPISVNVSALQFRQPDFVDRVTLALDRAGLPAHLLELELTESILLDDVADAQARLAELDALGVQLALDDFGTGYSSLAYLKDLPLDRLKLDRSFVAPLPEARRQAAIVQAVVQMAMALGIDVVAEGVETESQADFLRSCGCPTVQGFLFGKPMEPARLAEQWLQPPPAAAPARREEPGTLQRPAGVHADVDDRIEASTAAAPRRSASKLTLVKA